MSSVTVTPAGEIALPAELRERHGLAANSKVRVVETRHGILLVPLTDSPMAPELAQELAEWQSLGAAAWDSFSFNEGGNLPSPAEELRPHPPAPRGARL